MEEELQKRNTDCVYFLASPLTCKKGMDCEYRHNEIARLNPRDCWYWLAATCLNPTCAFRHPPLEKDAPAPSESSSSVLANKATIPCFFYFNAFCNKGDRCSFLHGPPHAHTPTTASAKSVNPSTTITHQELLLDNNKTSLGNHIVSAPTKPHFNPIQTPPKAVLDLKLQPKPDVHQPPAKNRTQPPSLPLIAVSHFEEHSALKSDSLLPAEGFIQNRSHVCKDQTSGEQEDDHFGPEERWESSPGFDVIVDDKSESLGYEDDGEYLMALESERRELNDHFVGYDFQDPVDYTDAELSYEGETYDSFDHVDNVHMFNDVGNNSGCSRDSILDSLLSRKRELLPMELAINDRRGVDLRDHLKKRRLIDTYTSIPSSRRHDLSRLLGQSQERHCRRGTSQRLHGRLASKVERNGAESLGDNGTLSSGANQRHWLRHSHSTRSMQHYRKKRQFHSSEVPWKLAPRERGKNETATSFTGPKTLAQIKEEKKKATENRDSYGKSGCSLRTTSSDFEGPKPLSEILKDKMRLGSVRGCNGNSAN